MASLCIRPPRRMIGSGLLTGEAAQEACSSVHAAHPSAVDVAAYHLCAAAHTRSLAHPHACSYFFPPRYVTHLGGNLQNRSEVHGSASIDAAECRAWRWADSAHRSIHYLGGLEERGGVWTGLRQGW